MGRRNRPRAAQAAAGALVLAVVLSLPLSAKSEDTGLDGEVVAAGDGTQVYPDRSESTPATVSPMALPVTGEGAPEREVQCLARNIYWEAGGEPEIGKVAVAAVTLNRVNDPRFPKSVCGVVRQGAGVRGRCQFTWACDGRWGVSPRADARWRESLEVAREVLDAEHPDPTGGALFFHGVTERPSWSRVKVRSAKIGNHLFYRDHRPRDTAEETARHGRS